MKNSEKTLDMIVNLCKNRGFVSTPAARSTAAWPTAGDYGPLGVEFKNNVKKALAEKVRAGKPLQRGPGRRHPDEPPDLGHHRPRGQLLGPAFGLPRPAKAAHRADKLISDSPAGQGVDVDAMTFDEMDAFIAQHEDVVCPVCGKHDFTPHPQVQPDVQDGHRRHRGFLLHLLPAAGDRPGHLCQLCQHPAHHPPQAALRRLPGGQGFPQRDHPRQLHLPHP